MDIWDDFKQHPGLAIIFLVVGFTAGLGTFKYLSGIFNLDVVLRDSYIYKSEIEKTHVPQERFKFTSDELKAVKLDIENLRKLNNQLQAAQNSMSNSVCQRYAQTDDELMSEQRSTEASIQSALAPINLSYRYKNEQELLSDSKRVAELRKHSELINTQIIQIRQEIAKCGR